MNETNLTPRQNLIITIINSNDGIARAQIEKLIENQYPASKPTIARDLINLVGKNLIRIEGKGKNTHYHSFNTNLLLKYFDVDQYFAREADQRTDVKKTFTFDIFDHLNGLILPDEVSAIEKINKKFTKETHQLNPDIYQRELERFIIELSWKSSRIEGNTYSLLETETLIKQSIEAKGHTKEEAIMILNHKVAFEAIIKDRSLFKSLSLSSLTQLHNLIVKDLNISTGIRPQAVGITGTTYRPLDNQWQINEALEKLIIAVNSVKYPLEKALIANAMISYIQPFSDGNKRTGRMIANALLLAHDYYPLSYRSVGEITYKKALILFYEQNSIYHLKKIFIDQYQFALATYFNFTNISKPE